MAAGGLTRTAAVVALGRGATTCSVLAMWGILARPWTQSQLGVFLALWTAATTLAPIFTLGLPTALLCSYPRLAAEDRRRLVWSAAVLLAIAGGVLAVGGRLLAPALVAWLQPAALRDAEGLAQLLTAFTPYVFAAVAGGFVEPALVVAGKAGWQAWLAAATGAGMLGVATATLLADWSVAATLWWLSAISVIRLAGGTVLVSRAVRAPGRLPPPSAAVSMLWRDALPIGLADAVGSVSRYTDRLVVLFFFAAGTFPQYQLGAVEVPVGLLLSAIVTVLVPEVSRLYAAHRLDGIASLWRLAVGRLALLVLPLSAFLFAFAPPLLSLYATERYAEARWVFRVFLLALPLRCAVYNPLLVGMGKARWALWGSVGDLAANALLSVALVRWLLSRGSSLAFLGPAAAAVAATYLQVAFLVGAIAWHLRWRLREVLPWGVLARVGAGAAAAAGVARWVAAGWEAPAAVLGVGTLAFAALAGALLLASRPDRQELRRMLASLRGTPLAG